MKKKRRLRKEVKTILILFIILLNIKGFIFLIDYTNQRTQENLNKYITNLRNQ